MLPTWDGEIYLELHRGTISNIARMKRLNRMAERRLENLEFLNVSLCGGLEPGVLETLWKRLLLNQFHDILPGSAIPSVYQRTFRELEELIQKADAEVLSMVSKATLPEEDSLLLFNPTSHPHHELIWGDDGRCSEVTLPPFSSQVIHPSELAPLRSSLPPRDGLYTLENPLVRYQFDSNALLVSAMHKATGRELIPRNRPANLLACHVDRPNQYDAWEIEREYMNMPQARPETKILSFSATLFCQVLEVEYRWENSTARQRILLAGNSARLDFVTEVDWHETHRMLRVEFPLSLHFDQVRCDLGFGFIRRSALDNLTSERNQFEFSCQKYIACGEDGDRAALLNDCKYGASARNGALGLTLLRSARYPDELTDRGHHSFTYSFLAFSDEATLLQEAVALNAPLLQFPGRTGTITSPVKELAVPGAALEALKFAEDGSGDFIVRLVEQLGEHASGTLEFSFPVDISSVSLLEEPGSRIAPCKGTSIHLAFQPFEIISLRCRPIPSGPA